MSESVAARTSTSLAITEKKPNTQRPAGCVGIFFQLFDWNRRFSKKKFFPKKLLPPVRAKVSKKFNADEKLPVRKHLLIAADENNGGFPSNVKKNVDGRVNLELKKHEMRAPGLVARLMGLEAMPVGVINQDKCNKGSDGSDCKTDLSPEKGNVRPQKVQKTGVSERRPVTRFGAEALQIKNVLSRSRKHHPLKLVSPVKSPKLGRNSSRLMDAAARILEPGIQATNRARCSLTYSNSMHKEDVMSEVKADVGSQCHSKSNFIEALPLNARSTCRSCGNFFDSTDMRSVAEEQDARFNESTPNFREVFLRGLEESRPKPAIYLENETDVVLLKTGFQSECVGSRTEENVNVKSETIRNAALQSHYHNQIPVSRMFTSQKDTSPSLSLQHKNRRRNQMLIGDGVPPRSKLVNVHTRRVSSTVNAGTETKDFIALNRNINRTRVRVPCKTDNFEPDRGMQKSPVRKRRTLNATKPVDTAAITSSSSLEEQRSRKGNDMIRNGPRMRANSASHNYAQSRPVTRRGSRGTDVVSFAFSSPIKSCNANFSRDEMDVNTRDQFGQSPNENSRDKIVMEENALKKFSQNSLRLNGDALGALLEQKLKELTHQAENEAASGFAPSTRTTASILQELISALTTERPILDDDEDHLSCGSNVGIISQSKSRNKRLSNSFPRKVDHFSPGCVLDALFSNESCISSSIDESSGQLLQSESMDCSCDTVQPPCSDTDLLDSASSTIKGRTVDLVTVTNLLNHISAVLQNVNLVHAKLTGTKLNFVQEIVLNAELLFGNAAQHSSSKFVDFLIGPFLDELETLVIAAWKDSVILGLEARKEESPLRRFLFDCVIECLDVKYSRYGNSGFRTWSRLPKCMNADVLVKMFDEEVRKWIAFAGKTPDEIIEKEMSTSLGKWTDFEIEAFEIGSQMNLDLVRTLVDEIVIDLIRSEFSFY